MVPATSMCAEQSVSSIIAKKSVKMSDVKFEIIETIGTLSESPQGWNKELNLISWNERKPKYDLRDWSPDHSKSK